MTNAERLVIGRRLETGEITIPGRDSMWMTWVIHTEQANGDKAWYEVWHSYRPSDFAVQVYVLMKVVIENGEEIGYIEETARGLQLNDVAIVAHLKQEAASRTLAIREAVSSMRPMTKI